jgi:lipoyl(octanoyl) transferase
MKNRTVLVSDLGLQNYKEAFEKQTKLFEHLKSIKIANKHNDIQQLTDNYFLFTEHPHVYTLGKSGKENHLLIDEEKRRQKQVDFIKTNRGGDITYHGPGQIVGYPIIDLDNFDLDILAYMRQLEEMIIQVLAIYNIKGERSEGETGVWLDVGKSTARKICAMGVKTSRWVTMHGFALNVDVDLSYFNHIIPCGIKNKGVTSMAKELGYVPDKTILKQQILDSFTRLFHAEVVLQD